MPTLNREKFIREAVKSVINQTYQNFELIIKDGGDCYLTIKDLLNEKVIYIKGKDKNLSHAFNQGLKMATGDIFCWANDDDFLYQDTFERVVKNFKKEWLYGKTDFYKDNVKIGEMGCPCDFETLKKANVIPQPSVFWSRKVFEEVGYMDETLLYAQDYDYWLRVIKKFPDYVFLNESLARYNIHSDQILNKKSQEQKMEALLVSKKYL